MGTRGISTVAAAPNSAVDIHLAKIASKDKYKVRALTGRPQCAPNPAPAVHPESTVDVRLVARSPDVNADSPGATASRMGSDAEPVISIGRALPCTYLAGFAQDGW